MGLLVLSSISTAFVIEAFLATTCAEKSLREWEANF